MIKKFQHSAAALMVVAATLALAPGMAAAQATYDANLDTVADEFGLVQTGLIEFVTLRVVPLILVGIAFIYGLRIAFRGGQMALRKIGERVG